MPLGRAEDRLIIVFGFTVVVAVGQDRLAIDPPEPGFVVAVVLEVRARRVQGVEGGDGSVERVADRGGVERHEAGLHEPGKPEGGQQCRPVVEGALQGAAGVDGLGRGGLLARSGEQSAELLFPHFGEKGQGRDRLGREVRRGDGDGAGPGS